MRRSDSPRLLPQCFRQWIGEAVESDLILSLDDVLNAPATRRGDFYEQVCAVALVWRSAADCCSFADHSDAERLQRVSAGIGQVLGRPLLGTRYSECVSAIPLFLIGVRDILGRRANGDGACRSAGEAQPPAAHRHRGTRRNGRYCASCLLPLVACRLTCAVFAAAEFFHNSADTQWGLLSYWCGNSSLYGGICYDETVRTIVKVVRTYSKSRMVVVACRQPSGEWPLAALVCVSIVVVLVTGTNLVGLAQHGGRLWLCFLNCVSCVFALPQRIWKAATCGTSSRTPFRAL